MKIAFMLQWVYMKTKDIQRFWKYVNKQEGCWDWIGGIKSTGRGNFWLNGKTEIAPRVSWAIHRGGLPKLCVLHTCDNGRCVRPDHLFLGTLSDNTQDMLKKGRHVGNRKTSAHDLTTMRFLRQKGFILKDIASETGFHIATVQRILSGNTLYAD